MTSLAVTLRQPVQMSTSLRSDGVLDTVDHVPGWVVRGALAAAWIRTHGRPDSPGNRPRFVQLFEGGVRFGPLFRSAPPPPLSAHQHKYAQEMRCPAPLVDAALALDLTIPFECPGCHQEWVPMRRDPSEPKRLAHIRTSVVIDPATATAAPGLLFSRRRIAARDPLADGAAGGSAAVTFTGAVTGDAALVAELGALTGVRLGGRRTSHGAVDLAVGDGPVLSAWLRPDRVLILRLVSPGIFIDDSGRPVTSPSDAELTHLLGVRATIEKSWTRWGSVGGWHAASGLPKPTETVVEAGSTYAVRLAADPTEQALRQLMERGIGLRRHEGFGHLGGPYRLPVDGADERARNEALAALTEADLMPFYSLGTVNGRITAELAAAIRAAITDPALAGTAMAVAKAQGGTLTGPRDADKVSRLLALPPLMSDAIVTRLEQR